MHNLPLRHEVTHLLLAYGHNLKLSETPKFTESLRLHLVQFGDLLFKFEFVRHVGTRRRASELGLGNALERVDTGVRSARLGVGVLVGVGVRMSCAVLDRIVKSIDLVKLIKAVLGQDV